MQSFWRVLSVDCSEVVEPPRIPMFVPCFFMNPPVGSTYWVSSGQVLANCDPLSLSEWWGQRTFLTGCGAEGKKSAVEMGASWWEHKSWQLENKSVRSSAYENNAHVIWVCRAADECRMSWYQAYEWVLCEFRWVLMWQGSWIKNSVRRSLWRNFTQGSWRWRNGNVCVKET